MELQVCLGWHNIFTYTLRSQVHTWLCNGEPWPKECDRLSRVVALQLERKYHHQESRGGVRYSRACTDTAEPQEQSSQVSRTIWCKVDAQPPAADLSCHMLGCRMEAAPEQAGGDEAVSRCARPELQLPDRSKRCCSLRVAVGSWPCSALCGFGQSPLNNRHCLQMVTGEMASQDCTASYLFLICGSSHWVLLCFLPIQKMYEEWKGTSSNNVSIVIKQSCFIVFILYEVVNVFVLATLWATM